jgi:hypothetical protein
MKHVFNAPVTFEGTEYKELDLKLEEMTGRDISAAKREWAVSGNFSPVPSADMDFCAILAAKASKQPLEFMQALPAREYTRLTQAVSNFLMS